MRKGDKVSWVSRTEGMHTGVIVAVVPWETYPFSALPQRLRSAPLSRSMGGRTRMHKSYVCESGGRLYWPAAGKLRKERA